MKTILTILVVTMAASTLGACVEYRGGPPPRVLVEERQGWVPGHWSPDGAFWVAGHWR